MDQKILIYLGYFLFYVLGGVIVCLLLEIFTDFRNSQFPDKTLTAALYPVVPIIVLFALIGGFMAGTSERLAKWIRRTSK